MDQEKTLVEVDSVIIRFAGDSGDGMQLTGTQFTDTSASVGNDINTLPDYPAEIRAPAGSLPGVSAFQLHFSNQKINTPGDSPNVLVAMNPAALQVHLPDLIEGGILLVNIDTFNDKNLKKAGYEENPLENGSLEEYRTFKLTLSALTLNAVEETGLTKKQAERCKNFFALGLLYYLYDRPLNHTIEWIEKKFGKDSTLTMANILALKAGHNYADTCEIFTTHYQVKKAKLSAGIYRKITGNEAAAIGFVTGAELAKKTLFYGNYPITPASDILHYLARYKNYGVKTFQAEDEIAAVCSAIGASFAGHIALTGSSGPGIALKTEAIGLAVIAELPLIIANVQRAGPSTGLPTKPEQGDLLQVLFGRNSESPTPVVAPATPKDCFYMAIEAVRIAIKYMTPVFFLSDGYLANGAEPWQLPKLEELPKIEHYNWTDVETFAPYRRDEKTLARPWAIPGTPGLEHRIGGLEKENISGNVCYKSENHELMIHLRAQKIENIANDIPELEIIGEPRGKLLVLSWGGTYGAVATAVNKAQQQGLSVSFGHLRHLNPFPNNLGDVLKNFQKILIPEMNMGQLLMLIRAKYLVDAKGYSKVQGKPFMVAELLDKIKESLQ